MISTLFNLVRSVPLPPLLMVLAVAGVYIRKKVRKGEFDIKIGGSAKKPAYKRVNGMTLGEPKAHALFKSGDYGFLAQDKDGKVAVIAGDWVKPGGPKYETAIFLMDDYGKTPRFITGRRGKCTGAAYINGELHLIITDKGSLWEGTRNPRMYKLIGNKLKLMTTFSFQSIAGASSMDVNWAFVKQGWNQQYMGDRIYLTAVRASKQVFDDWKPSNAVPGSGQTRLFSAPADSMYNKTAWIGHGGLREASGKILISPRNNHINGASLDFHEGSGSHILFIHDFNQKTVYAYQHDGSDDLATGYRRIAAPSSAGVGSSPWRVVHNKLGLPTSGQAKLRHDTHWQGIAWTASLAWSKTHGDFIGVGGWEGPYDRCAQIKVTIR